MPKARRRGNYLKAADIGGRSGTAIVRFIEAGERNVTDYRKDGALEIPVTPVTPPVWATGGDDPKTWSLNRTSEDTVRNHLGEDTEGWINQVTCINVLPQNVRGQMRDVLYSEAPTPEEQPKEAPPTATSKQAPAPAPTQAPPTAEDKLPPFSEVTTMWLKYNSQLIGAEVPALDYNSMPDTARKELWNSTLLYQKDNLFYLSPEAAQVNQ